MLPTLADLLISGALWNALGIIFCLAGAFTAGRALFIDENTAAQLAAARYASNDPAENVKLPLAQMLIKQSRSARTGLHMVASGSGMQLAALAFEALRAN
jgi:hypothetical protein